MTSVYEMYNDVKEKLIRNREIQEVYQARWVWYHTILALELLILIMLQIAILVKI